MKKDPGVLIEHILECIDRRDSYRSHLVDQPLHVLVQLGDLVLQDVPDDLPVGPKILVDQHVPHPGDFFPFDIEMVRLEILGQILHGLTDHSGLRKQALCRTSSSKRS